MIKEKDVNFLKKLEEHPHLRKRFEEILNITDSDDMMTVDEAEERAIEEVRKLGQEILQEWAINQHNRQMHKVAENHPEAKKQGKKNSIGAQHLGR
jgi:hypothetical protein